MTAKDTVVVPISDMHSGGSTALFPDSIRWFKHGNHTPNSTQVEIFKHWMKCAESVAVDRKGKDMIIVVDGDSVDGNHHNTPQLTTILPNEQINIHIELMKAFMNTAKWNDKTDKIYYVTGTEAHVEDNEDIIGLRMKAEPNGNVHAWDELQLIVNGKHIWFAHQGTSAGRGANQGNALRNWLKDIFTECVQEGNTPPDFIVTGHSHKPYYTPYCGRLNGDYHLVHGMICPSWQSKTRFGYKVAALQKNKIGMQWFTVTKDGHITQPKEMVMK